jgi:2-polyprenyl-6-methoxyphenol hydroxylase-like FAD-dependent oxidoreductase
LEQRYAGAHTMAGVMPIGRAAGFAAPQAAFFWSLRQDQLEGWRREGLEAWKAKVLALWPRTQALLEQIDAPERLTFARYRHRTLKVPAERGVIHIGDAWRSTSPQLGQGRTWLCSTLTRSPPRCARRPTSPVRSRSPFGCERRMSRSIRA